MAEYDGLPLNTPTKISEDTDIEVWATRTPNGGTVEHRVKPGTDADRTKQLDARLTAAIASNSTYLAIPSPSNAENTAQLKSLTRQVQALLRKAQGRYDGLD